MKACTREVRLPKGFKMLRMMTHFKMPSNSFLFSVGSPRANSAQATLTDELQLVIFRLQVRSGHTSRYTASFAGFLEPSSRCKDPTH